MRALSLLLLPFTLLGQDSTLLILHKAGSTLGFYNRRGELVADVPVGRHPHEMALAADGRTVYITDNGAMSIEEAGEGGNTVSVVDLATRAKTGEVSLGRFRRPHGIAIDRRTGLLFVTTELPDQLLILDPRPGLVLRGLPTNGQTSHMVALGSGARWAFVSNCGSNTVSAIDVATGAIKLIPTGARPEGSVMSADRRFLYVANREAAKISIIDTGKRAVVGEIRTGRGPVRLALTPDGKRLVYACMHDHAIEIVDLAERKVVGKVRLGGEPVSLSISPDGRHAYSSAQEIDTVYVVSLAGQKVVRTIKTAPGSGPDAVLEVASK
jgi:YVTN family beta-propeller protein